MAKGSEKMSWKILPAGTEHTCAVCGKTLRIEDVGEHRTLYDLNGRGTTVLWCTEHRGGVS